MNSDQTNPQPQVSRPYALEVIGGPDEGQTTRRSTGRATVGSAPDNDLTLSDEAVSAQHLEIVVAGDGIRLTDLDSPEGTWMGPCRLGQVLVTGPVELRLGSSVIRVRPLDHADELAQSNKGRFGSVIGQSPAMLDLFRTLERVAGHDVTVLLEGETGTGKGLIAEEIHRRSLRRGKPLVTVDCGAIPPSLIESELFGHTRGAYTGATDSRVGAIEQADGGTLFLDEIGELDLAMQPRLLRLLERQQIKRVGESHYRQCSVRIIAATHRNLRRCVNQGTFRADLFYRLVVVHCHVPALRERAGDLPLLVQALLPTIAVRLGVNASDIEDEVLEQMADYPWPGNVREVRNFLERVLSVRDLPMNFSAVTGAWLEPSDTQRENLQQLATLPFKVAKNRWLEYFDVEYLSRLLAECDYNVARAARRSGIARVYIFRLIKKYGLRQTTAGWPLASDQPVGAT